MRLPADYNFVSFAKALPVRLPTRAKPRVPIVSQTKPQRKPILQRLGPGLITGAADDDPSGIATYSQAGAQYGFGLLWSILLTTPLMAAIQGVSARIGPLAGHGLAANIRDPFPAWLLHSL